MEDYQGRGWYLRKTGNDVSWGYFLHFINNTLEHAMLCKSLNYNDHLTLMSHRGLVELLGCKFPPGSSPESPADGGITFEHNDKIISVCPFVAVPQ